MAPVNKVGPLDGRIQKAFRTPMKRTGTFSKKRTHRFLLFGGSSANVLWGDDQKKHFNFRQTFARNKGRRVRVGDRGCGEADHQT